MDVDTLKGALETINSNMETLRFDTNDGFIYKALVVTPITSGQPPVLTVNKLKFILETKKDLKNTLYRGVRAFIYKLEKSRTPIKRKRFSWKPSPPALLTVPSISSMETAIKKKA